MKLKKIVAISAVAIVVASTTGFAALKTKQDKLSYALGASVGKSLADRKFPVKMDVFVQALTNALEGQKMEMTPAQVKQVLVDFQKEMMAKMQAKLKKEAANNEADEVAFLKKNAKVKGIKTTDTGLQYRVIKKGTGTAPTQNDTVTVNYKGSLLNGTVFDSSFKRGKPATFMVKQVIPGWQEALKLMKPGAQWELFIPSKLAYGKNGAPGAIPPNSMLKFTVDLIKVTQKK